MPAGEEKIWNDLLNSSPEEVCLRTGARFDAGSGLYTLTSFGNDFTVSARDRVILPSAAGEELFRKTAYFFRMSALGYLVLSKDVKETGQLINPLNMKTGQLFFRGSHALPLEKAAAKYGADKDAFLKRGSELDGEALGYGDASLRLLPFPNVPAVMILWLADEEFGSRADLLFDSSCETRMPVDIVWSVAMMSVIAFL